MAYVILCRVSTEEQANSKAGINGQEDACREFIQRHPAQIREVLYEEDYSGGLPLEKRPILQAAIGLLKKGDILLVHKRDRMFRGDPFTNGLIEHTILKRGATLRSVAGEGTENDDPSSILLRRITDMFSEHERNVIKQRTKTALQSKKRRNERVGTIPYGYALCDDHIHLQPIPEQQQGIVVMQRLRSQGFSLRMIGRHLESMAILPPKSRLWTAESVRQILNRPPVPGSVSQADSADAFCGPAQIGPVASVSQPTLQFCTP